jgi:hypothetical protein
MPSAHPITVGAPVLAVQHGIDVFVTGEIPGHRQHQRARPEVGDDQMQTPAATPRFIHQLQQTDSGCAKLLFKRASEVVALPNQWTCLRTSVEHNGMRGHQHVASGA